MALDANRLRIVRSTLQCIPVVVSFFSFFSYGFIFFVFCSSDIDAFSDRRDASMLGRHIVHSFLMIKIFTDYYCSARLPIYSEKLAPCILIRTATVLQLPCPLLM